MGYVIDFAYLTQGALGLHLCASTQFSRQTFPAEVPLFRDFHIIPSKHLSGPLGLDPESPDSSDVVLNIVSHQVQALASQPPPIAAA